MALKLNLPFEKRFVGGYDLLLTFFLVALWMILYFIPFGFVPDLLNFSDPAKTANLLGVLFQAVVSIIGIVITVYLLFFGLLRERHGRNWSDYITGNKYLSLSITLLISLTILSLFTLLTYNLDDSVSNGELNLAYYILYLSIVTIVSLVPASLLILKDRDFEFLTNEINSIDFDARDVMVQHYLNKNKAKNNYDLIEETESREKHPLSKLTSLIISYSKVNDYYAIELICKSSFQRCLKMIDDGKEKYYTDRTDFDLRNHMRFTFIIFIEIWNELIITSVRNKDRGIIKELWNGILVIHEKFNELHLSLAYSDSLHEFTQGFIKLLCQEYREALVENRFKICNIFRFHLDNSLPSSDQATSHLTYRFGYLEMQMSGTLNLHHSNLEDHCSKIYWDFPGYINDIVLFAIDKKDIDLFDDFSFCQQSLVKDVIFSKISYNKKIYLIERLLMNSNYSLTRALNTGLVDNIDQHPLLDSLIISDQDTEIVESLVKNCGKVLAQVKISAIGTYTLESLGGPVRVLLANFDEDPTKLAMFIYLINIYEYMVAKFCESNSRYLDQLSQIQRDMESFKKYYLFGSPLKPLSKPRDPDRITEKLDLVLNAINIPDSYFKPNLPWNSNTTSI